jgi:hypothetical protein
MAIISRPPDEPLLRNTMPEPRPATIPPRRELRNKSSTPNCTGFNKARENDKLAEPIML